MAEFGVKGGEKAKDVASGILSTSASTITIPNPGFVPTQIVGLKRAESSSASEVYSFSWAQGESIKPMRTGGFFGEVQGSVTHKANGDIEISFYFYMNSAPIRIQAPMHWVAWKE